MTRVARRLPSAVGVNVTVGLQDRPGRRVRWRQWPSTAKSALSPVTSKPPRRSGPVPVLPIGNARVVAAPTTIGGNRMVPGATTADAGGGWRGSGGRGGRGGRVGQCRGRAGGLGGRDDAQAQDQQKDQESH